MKLHNEMFPWALQNNLFIFQCEREKAIEWAHYNTSDMDVQTPEQKAAFTGPFHPARLHDMVIRLVHLRTIIFPQRGIVQLHGTPKKTIL